MSHKRGSFRLLMRDVRETSRWVGTRTRNDKNDLLSSSSFLKSIDCSFPDTGFVSVVLAAQLFGSSYSLGLISIPIKQNKPALDPLLSPKPSPLSQNPRIQPSSLLNPHRPSALTPHLPSLPFRGEVDGWIGFWFA